MAGLPAFAPATAEAVLALLDHYQVELRGRHAVVVGRSVVVGKPVAHLLLDRHATVTICHSRTPDLAAITRQADVLVAAVGRAWLIGPGHVSPGSTVIDVGTNATPDGGLAGDVDPAVAAIDGVALTPVPGGVGPVTTALLLRHVVSAAAADYPSRALTCYSGEKFLVSRFLSPQLSRNEPCDGRNELLGQSGGHLRPRARPRPLDPQVRQAWRRLLVAELPAAPAVVADLGCGTGTLSVLLAAEGYAVTGLDFAPQMIRAARAKARAAGVSARFELSDAAAPTLPAESFDVVLARHVLWAMPDADDALAAWLRLLLPGGLLLLSRGAGRPAPD